MIVPVSLPGDFLAPPPRGLPLYARLAAIEKSKRRKKWLRRLRARKGAR